MWLLYHRYLRNVDLGTIIFHEFCFIFSVFFLNFKKWKLNMITGCSVEDACFTNHRVCTHQEQSSKFHEVFHEPLRSSLVNFLNVDITSMKSVFVCFKHFDDVHLNKEDKRIRLNMHLNPIQQSRICYKNSKFHESRQRSRLPSRWGRVQK